jgi:flagellar basal-body rod modification protein FlgD
MIDTSNSAQNTLLRSLQELSAKPDKQKKLGQEDFFRLMTTQLQNQDPTKPMDNENFLAQIAQFSIVSGVGDLQKSFDSLSQSLVSNQALQATNLVGRQVLAPTGVASLDANGALKGSVDLPVASNQVTINIQDASGQTVRRLEMGSQAAGPVPFQWNGIRDDGQFATPGKYFLTAEAVTTDGQTEAVDTLVASTVRSVTLNKDGGLMLDLDGVGPLDFNQVREIL